MTPPAKALTRILLGALPFLLCSPASFAQEPPRLELRLNRVVQLPGGRSLGKFEPVSGCYLGAYIELDPKLTQVYVDSNQRQRKLPEEFEAIVGKQHAMYFFYQGYGTPLPQDWIKKLVDRSKLIHIALEPNQGLDEVRDDRYLQSMADELRSSGAKIFLRFASEMNGTWVRYGGDPAKYRQKFRLVAQVMRKRAPNVAMVWCPYTTPERNIASYYPGDDWVDWVGVNMYSVTFFNQDPTMPAHEVSPIEMLSFMYKTYSKRKPIMICEYGASNFSRLENRSVAPFATKNIRSLYSALQTEFLGVKAINYFNSNNLVIRHAANNNYAVTHEPQVLEAYRTAIAPTHFLATPVPDVLESDVLRGRWNIIATIRGASKESIIRFLVDKRVAHAGVTKNGVRIDVDADSWTPGRHEIVAEALDSDGRTIATQTMQVETAR